MAWTDNLVSYWKLDEASGDRADSHGSNTLTDNNTVTSATGVINSAADFESTNSETLSHTSNSDFQTGDIDFTWTCWVKLESKPNHMGIISKYSDEYTIWFESASDRFEFFVGTGALGAARVTANNFGAPSLGSWCFIVAWHDSVNNVVGIQVNNGTANTVSHSGGITANSNGFVMGNVNSSFPYDGLIDEVGYWKRILTTQEKTDLYNGGAGLAYPFSGGGGSVLPSPFVVRSQAVNRAAFY